MDPLSAVFLGCFVFGFGALLLSFLLGGVEGFDIGGHHFDLFGGQAEGGHLDGGGLDVGHVDSGGLDVGHADAGGANSGAQHSLPILNPSTVLTFLTWFGGAGFILRNYYGAVAMLSLGLSALAGLIGAGLVFLFILKVLLPQQTAAMRQADYDPVGCIGRVTVPIRADGVGEVVFTRAGTRRSAGARSLDGHALEQGAEVVIAKYERGLAYVQPWEEFVSRERRLGAAEGSD